MVDRTCRKFLPRRIKMKKLTMSLWLALAAAGIFAAHAMPSKHNAKMDMPLPTCPPECPGH